jgi:poly(ribitol-phosphate) beta-N-acetylglucosaminyltransferase
VLRMETVEKVVAFVADLIGPGKQRDAILLRRFDHEVARLLEDDFLRLDRPVQRRVQEGVGRLAREHLTDEIAGQLGAETRIRLAVARDGDLDDLIAVIRQDAEIGVPPTVARDGRRYARYAGWGRLPDACFDVTTAPDWAAKLDATAIRWDGDTLTITARGATAPQVTVSAEEVAAEVRPADRPGVMRIRFRATDLLAGAGATGRRRIVSAQPGPFDPGRALGRHSATGAAGAAAIRAPHVRRPAPRVRRHGRRLYVITAVIDASGRLMISVVPLTARRVLARISS